MERTHVYGPSHVGHGEAQCIHCLGTNRENAVVSPNHCPSRILDEDVLRPIPVTRADAGGQLWAVGAIIDNVYVEFGETPSYDYDAVKRRSDELNTLRAQPRVP